MHATAASLHAHRPALVGHCYRMLGSISEADDAVQETLVRAWKSLDRFEGRSSMRTWLYRIATNVCLDLLAARSRRARPMELGPAGTIEDELTALPSERWVEPIPDALAIPSDEDPSQLAVLRQSVRLAFVAALQHLPPKQRAVLILTEVLGWSAAEVAETLDTSVPSVNSALQRARATMSRTERPAAGSTAELTPEQTDLLERYVSAFERYDVEALTALLRDDAQFSMPPYSLWLLGPEPVAGWLAGRGAACRGSRLVPTAACGSPAFGQYKPSANGDHVPWALIVLELSGDRIASWTSFLDTERFFPLFGLPPRL